MKFNLRFASVLFAAAAFASCTRNNDTHNFPVLSGKAFDCYYGKESDEHGEHGEGHGHDGGHAEEASTGSFGDKITADGAMTVADFKELMKAKDSAEVKLSATVHEVCQKKGCWMDVELADGNTMTVRFKDYGFFVPKNCAGKTAVMMGMARKEVETVEWLKEKAKDANKSKEEIAAIKEPVTNLAFEASGVIIK